jgi:hypothetical protein
MHVTRLAHAAPYDAPRHHDMVGLRLQGFDVALSGGDAMSSMPEGGR